MKNFKSILHGISYLRCATDVLLSLLYTFVKCVWINEISQISKRMTTLDNDGIKTLTLIYISYFLFMALVDSVQNSYSEISFQRVCHNSQVAYFNNIYRIKPEILKEQNTGYVTDLISKLVNQQANVYFAMTWSLSYAVLYMSFALIRVSMIHWSIGVLLFTLITLSTTILTKGKLYNRKNVKESNRTSHVLSGFITDCIINIGTIQKMDAESFVNDSVTEKKMDFYRASKKGILINEIFRVISRTLLLLFVPFTLLLMCIFDFNRIECASLIAILSLEIFTVSKDFMVFILNKERYDTLYEDFTKIISEENNRKEFLYDPFNELSIHNLEYRYSTKDSDNYEKEVVISIPDFNVKAGDKICITGESGQGKTTLLNLITNEIETDSILLNRKTSEKRLNCIFVSQDVEVLDMTLRENLSFGRNIPDRKIIESLREVGLGKWFDNLKEGLDSRLGEKGVFVSTGQRQRLNLVRGLLDESKDVYIIDEPTSNVDDATEELMVKFIEKKLDGKTLICVTHRPRIKEICNKLYVFENNTLSLIQK